MNARAVSELPFEQVSALAMDTQAALKRLVRLTEELRVKAMLGDKRARGLLHMLSDETCSLYAEAIMDLENGR